MAKQILWICTFAILGINVGFITLSLTGCDNGNSPETTSTPTADAGQDFTHDIFKDGVSLTLKGNAQNGTITWDCTPPASAKQPTFSDKTIAQPTVSGFDKLGEYTFKITVTNGTESKSATVKVTLVATLTKVITVPAITTVANPMNFGEVSSLTGWDADFPSSDVTYTLTLSQKGVIKDTIYSTNATSISAQGRTDGIYTLTQTFMYKGVAISDGSRSVGIEVTGNYFGDMCVSETDYTEATLIQLTLTLAKTLTSGSIPPVVVSFVPMVSALTINFSPITPLPKDVTYTVTDNSTPPKSWNSASGFNGQITASEHYVNVNDNVTFTQTFYLNGVEITGAGSKRIVVAEALTAFVTSFVGITSDTGSVTLSITGIPPVTSTRMGDSH